MKKTVMKVIYKDGREEILEKLSQSFSGYAATDFFEHGHRCIFRWEDISQALLVQVEAQFPNRLGYWEQPEPTCVQLDHDWYDEADDDLPYWQK